MYRRILLAYDGSDPSDRALKEASQLALSSQAKLYVLGIVATGGAAALAQAAGPGAQDIYTRELDHITQEVEKVAGDLRELGIDAATMVRDGEPANEIIAYAVEIDADLAVIGHSDKGLLSRWIQGSTGSRLVSEMPCSLLIAS